MRIQGVRRLGVTRIKKVINKVNKRNFEKNFIKKS